MTKDYKDMHDLREELLDARDVVEAADDAIVRARQRKPFALEALEAALKEYWRKWGDK